MKSITTERGEVLLVEVPKENDEEMSSPWKISRNENGSFLTCILDGTFYSNKHYFEGYDTILGEITKDGPQFDCHDMVKSCPDNSGWLNYVGPTKYFDYATSSFVSLLNSQGVCLKNPMGEKPIPDISYGSGFGWMEEVDKWQTFEDNTLKSGHKYIAILKSK